MFRTNLGRGDRTLRVALGVVLMVAALTGAHALWGGLGALAFATAVVGWCPLYTSLRLSTCRPERPRWAPRLRP